MKIARTIGENRKLNRDGKCVSARLNFAASGVLPGEIDQALAEVYATAPEYWEGLPKESVEILRSPGSGILEIAVTYRSTDMDSREERRRRKRSGDREWRAEVEGKSQWQEHSLGCIFSRKTDPAAPDLAPGTLIDWNGLYGAAKEAGKIQVYHPEMSLECVATFRRHKAESRNYLRQVAALVGSVNAENFHNWHAGEVLFTGLVKSDPFIGRNGDELCDLTFRFFIRTGGERTAAGIEVGYVEGWDHLWLLHSPGPGKDHIHSVHVSRLYPRASFGVLEL